MLESGYDFSDITLGDQSLTLIDSSFNLPSSGFKALFLIGKFETKKASGSSVLNCPNFDKEEGQLAIGYKEE